MVFLAAILATVIYLTVTRRDVIDNLDTTAAPVAARHAGRERVMLGYYAVLAAATAGLLTWRARNRTAVHRRWKPRPFGARGGRTARRPGHRRVPRLLTSTSSASSSPTPRPRCHPVTRPAQQRGSPTWKRRGTTPKTGSGPQTAPPGPTWTARSTPALKAVRASNPDPATEQQALSALNSALR